MFSVQTITNACLILCTLRLVPVGIRRQYQLKDYFPNHRVLQVFQGIDVQSAVALGET